MTAKQLLTSNNVSPPVAAEALYSALDDLMAHAGAMTAERRCEDAHLCWSALCRDQPLLRGLIHPSWLYRHCLCHDVVIRMSAVCLYRLQHAECLSEHLTSRSRRMQTCGG